MRRNPDGLAKAFTGSDAAVVSVRWNNNTIDDLLSALRKAGVPRTLFVVGAGSLRMPDGRLWLDHMIEDGTAPPTSRSALEALDTLRGVTDLDWVVVSPSADIEPGERTGRFRIGGGERPTDAEGESRISTQDFAMAILDEIGKPRRSRERFTAGY